MSICNFMHLCSPTKQLSNLSTLHGSGCINKESDFYDRSRQHPITNTNTFSSLNQVDILSKCTVAVFQIFLYPP